MTLFKTIALACACAVATNLASAIIIENREELEEVELDIPDQETIILAQTIAELEAEKSKMAAPEDLQYFGTKTYKKKDRATKLAELWSVIAPVDASGNAIEQRVEASAQWRNMMPWFDWSGKIEYNHASDELKMNFPRIDHAQGLVAKVEWEPVASDGVSAGGYSGMYATGSDTVILRLSETENLGSWSTGLTPSLALKFLIDGIWSSNIHASPSYTPSTSWNFFEKPMSTRVEAVTDAAWLATKGAKMVEGTAHPFSNAISIVAIRGNDGKKIESKQVTSPYELRFDPAKDFGISAEKPEEGTNWYDKVKAAAKTGDTLFKVMAKARPDADWVQIANVKLLSDLVNSEFGDNRLFFQKSRAVADQKYWGWEWREKARSLETGMSQMKGDGDIWEYPTIPDGWPIHDSC